MAQVKFARYGLYSCYFFFFSEKKWLVIVGEGDSGPT